MIVGIPKETYPGETLVALLPSHVALLTKVGLGVMVESGAGEASGGADAAYRASGADVITDRPALFRAAQIIVQVRTPAVNFEKGEADLQLLGPQSTLIGLADPLGRPEAVRELAQRGARLYALELMPRISRAQSMDVLSSLATIVGYKAVLLAADRLPKLFPMLTTPAGTIPPARVLVIGAGVAGLQAIATARRLGAAVSAYDVRPAAKEQIRSLGAKAVEVPADAMDAAEESGGYAKALDEQVCRRQREGLAPTVATSDVIVSTAAVPGRRAPLLMTSDMVARMARGSIIVDVAAGSGGNCELTRPDEAVWHHGVLVLGPTNLPSTVPMHASQLYGRNVANLLLHLCQDGGLRLDLDDEIVRGILVTQGGEVVHARVRALLDAPPHQISAKG
jgi:H+-translocating NAD(P) transhydrogenase subunit alpha